MSVFDQLLEDIESDHKEWEDRGRELADKRKKVKALGDRALDAHEGRYDAAQAAFQKLEDTAKRLQGNERPPVKDSGTGGLKTSQEYPPEQSSIGLSDGVEVFGRNPDGSTGVRFVSRDQKWVREDVVVVTAGEVGDAGEVLGAPDQGGTFQQG